MLIAVLFFIVIPLGLDLYHAGPESRSAADRPRSSSGGGCSLTAALRDGLIALRVPATTRRARSPTDEPIAIGVLTDARGGATRRPSSTAATAARSSGTGARPPWRPRCCSRSRIRTRWISASTLPRRVSAWARDDLANALASFVRSILSGNSRFDRFVNGEPRGAHRRRAARPSDLSREGKLRGLSRRADLTDERFHNGTRQTVAGPDGGLRGAAFADAGRFR